MLLYSTCIYARFSSVQLKCFALQSFAVILTMKLGMINQVFSTSERHRDGESNTESSGNKISSRLPEVRLTSTCEGS